MNLNDNRGFIYSKKKFPIAPLLISRVELLIPSGSFIYISPSRPENVEKPTSQNSSRPGSLQVSDLKRS